MMSGNVAPCGVPTMLIAWRLADCLDDWTADRLDHFSRGRFDAGARRARVDRHEALGADRAGPVVVRPQPLEPKPRAGGRAALHPSLFVGPDHRHDPVVL